MASILEWAAFLTAATSCIAVTAGVVQIRQLRKQRVRDFEDLFVQRYWNIMDRLSLRAMECDTPDDRTIEADDLLAVVAYLRLSEDELDLRAERWVSKDTWEIWRTGIASQLSRWPFDAIWKEVSSREALRGDAGQFALLREAEEALYGKGFDPTSKSSAIQRWGRGR